MAKVFLFHKDEPEGVIYDDRIDDLDELRQAGWVDSPADFKVETNEFSITSEQAETARPEDLVNMVKAMGYNVLTEIEMTGKIAQASKALADYSNEELIAEAEKRGLKDPTVDFDADGLHGRFFESPTALTKEELVFLGNTKYKLGLRSSFSEATLIDKINAAMEA